MKLATFRKCRQVRLGIVKDGEIIDLNAALEHCGPKITRRGKPLPTLDMKGFLAGGSRLAQLARKVATGLAGQGGGGTRTYGRGVIFDLTQVELLPPIANPPKILCLARNYISHVEETKGDGPPPSDLLVFMKPSQAVIWPEAPIVILPECRELDHEVELAVVVGRGGTIHPAGKGHGACSRIYDSQ